MSKIKKLLFSIFAIMLLFGGIGNTIILADEIQNNEQVYQPNKSIIVDDEFYTTDEFVLADDEENYGLEPDVTVIRDSPSTRINGWTNCGGHMCFYRNLTRVRGWFDHNGNWYFLNPNPGTAGHVPSLPIGARRTGLINLNGYYFFLNPRNQGRMVTGWHLDGNTWFHFRSNGIMSIGWRESGGNWYFLNPPIGARGHVSGRARGQMLTGWISYNSHWYFLNPASGSGRNPNLPDGAMLTEWLLRNNERYFLNPNPGTLGHTTARPVGAMHTGWLTRGSNRYFLNTTNNHNANYGVALVGRVRARGWNSSVYNYQLFSRSGRHHGVFDNDRHFVYWRWQPAFTGVTQIPINLTEVPADWITYVRRGITNWNLANPNIRFVENNQTGNRVRVQNRVNNSETILGRVHGVWFETFRYLDTFHIELSRDGLRSHLDRPENRNHLRGNVIENVMTHELGHVLGLADGQYPDVQTGRTSPTLGGCDDCSIMNNYRNRNLRRLGNNLIPTNFDVQSSNMIYE